MAGDRLIAVTGASRGIGAAIAVELARRGFTVGCFSRKGRAPEAEGAAGLSARFVGIACDVTDEASLTAAMKALAGSGGRFFGLVNNAGIHEAHPSHAMATGAYEAIMATNATALFVACREAFPHLVAGGGGIIVNIGSFYDRMGVKRNLAYCASKAAVGAITRCLAVEWADKGIRVIDVAPGYIKTDINRAAMEEGPLADYLKKRIPGGAVGEAGDVARLVGALMGEDIPFLSGETIYLDGAQGIAL
jgi:NAD(P)-dependent dehydrogenase (short-subunit alcohol dehydrogenase family)